MRFMKGFFLLVFVLVVVDTNAQVVSIGSLAEAGHWKRIRSILQTQPPASEAERTYWSARVKHAFGDLDGAEGLARKAIALDNNNAAYHRELSAICLDELANHPGMFRTMRLAHDVKSELETVLTLDPKNIDAMSALMEYDWSAPSIGGGDREMAQKLTDRIAQTDAIRGYLARARIDELSGGAQITTAEGLLRTAVQSAPRDYRAHITLAEFYLLTTKNYMSAIQEAKAAIALAPDRSRPYADLATVYARGQNWNELDELLTQAEKAVPEDLNPYYQAAKTLLLEGRDFDRAEKYFRKYLTQEPEGQQPPIAGAHWRLGLVLEKEGKKPYAISELEESLRLQPDFGPAKEDLARLR